jgi:hypothetical protein
MKVAVERHEILGMLASRAGDEYVVWRDFLNLTSSGASRKSFDALSSIVSDLGIEDCIAKLAEGLGNLTADELRINYHIDRVALSENGALGVSIVRNVRSVSAKYLIVSPQDSETIFLYKGPTTQWQGQRLKNGSYSNFEVNGEALDLRTRLEQD